MLQVLMFLTRGLFPMKISDDEIIEVEKLLLPVNKHFSDEAKKIIRCWDSNDVVACAGSGKTTILLAKIKLLADRMPLENGAGMCVLSHTNVAVDIIKERFAGYEGRLLDYPNFIGTIQTFIDTFLALPYLRRHYDREFSVIDDVSYARIIASYIGPRKNRDLFYLIKNNLGDKYSDEVSFISSLHLDSDGNLYQHSRKIAGGTTKSSTQFSSIIESIRKDKGYIKYSEAFYFAEKAINELGNTFTDLFVLRFKYVFIDEYQDCTSYQRNILERVFNSQDCCFFRIGDPNQAIYGISNKEEKDWIPNETNKLMLNSSNRFGQGIADVLSLLRYDEETISSSIGGRGLVPFLYVYREGCEDEVLTHFISALRTVGLSPKGVFKAIGYTKGEQLKGVKIGSYWKEFNPSIYTGEKTMTYCFLEASLCDSLCDGQVYIVGRKFIEICYAILKLSLIKDPETGKYYTSASIKKYIENHHYDEYRECLMTLVAINDCGHEVKKTILDFLKKVFNYTDDNYRESLSFFSEDDGNGIINDKSKDNICRIDGEYTIQFDTIHGVKGETHDATLYLETEYKGSSDIIRTIKWHNGENHDLYNAARKLLYVGLSRPKELLCLAVKGSTYDRYKEAELFKRFQVIDLRTI